MARIRANQDFIGQKKNEGYQQARTRLLKEAGLEHASFKEKSEYLRPLRVKNKKREAEKILSIQHENAYNTGKDMVINHIKGHRVIKGNKALGVRDIHLYSDGKTAVYTSGEKDIAGDIKGVEIHTNFGGHIKKDEYFFRSAKEFNENSEFKSVSDAIKKSHGKLGARASLGRSSG